MSHRFDCPDRWTAEREGRRDADREWYRREPERDHFGCDEADRYYRQAFKDRREEIRDDERREEERQEQEAAEQRAEARRAQERADEENYAQEQEYYEHLEGSED